MPPRSGLGLWVCVVLALIIQTGEALNLNTPPPFSAADEVFPVSWTTVPGDPKSFNLWALCDNSQPFQLSTSGVRTDKSPFSVTVDPFISKIVTHPIFCTLQAKSLDGDVLLASTNPFQVNPDDQPMPAPTSHIQVSDSHTTSVISSLVETLTSTSPRFTTVSTANTDTTPTEPAKSQATSWLLSPAPHPTKSTTTFSSSGINSSPSSGTPTSVSDISPAPTSISLVNMHKSPVGAIIGGVIGGIVALLILVATLAFCRRRHKRVILSRHLDILRGTNPNAPVPTPIFWEKDDWLAKVDGAMAEAAKQSERARSRTESRPRPPGGSDFGHSYPDVYQSPGSMHPHVQRYFQPDLLAAAAPAPTRMYTEDDWESHDHLYTSHSTSDSESEPTTGGGSNLETGDTESWAHQDGLDGVERQIANDGPDITRMDVEARERRQEEILQQMRNVLDGQQESGYHDVVF